ncbi:MAG: TMAO reductase system periplasmic protein TorT [Rhodospirillaceae bacterium]|nr:TMAO reductase system periplasmic protein TorT [Rhodospirillaceae bacterium]
MIRSAKTVVLAALGGFAVAALAASGALAAEKPWYPFKVQVWDPPFNMDSPRKDLDYVPLEKAAKKWDICVSFPHMKDSYWLAVDYGVVEESRREGVRMTLVEAGGYTNLSKQISQIEDCVAAGAQGVVIGAISYDGLNNLVSELKSKNIPVIDVINGISSPDISAKSLVSFGEMGYKAGEYIAKLHPKGSGQVKVAWFPGPPGAGWVEAGNKGFLDAVKDSDIEVVDTKYGDTGKEVQLKLIEDVLEANPDIQYIVGTSPTAEAAVGLLKDRGLSDKIKVMAYYFTPPVYQGIKDGTILGAPTDSAVIQGRIAIDQVVRILEGKPYEKHVGPALYVIDSKNVNTFDKASSLAPDDFKPTFDVD